MYLLLYSINGAKLSMRNMRLIGFSNVFNVGTYLRKTNPQKDLFSADQALSRYIIIEAC